MSLLGKNTLDAVNIVNAWHGARAAERGENNMLGQINRIVLLQTACFVFLSSSFLGANTLLKTGLKVLSTLCTYHLVLEIGHAIGLFHNAAYKSMQGGIEKVVSSLSTVGLVSLSIHALALVIFKKQLAALSFLVILGLGALQLHSLLPKFARRPFHQFLETLRTVAPLVNPFNIVWYFNAAELVAQIYNKIVTQKKTLKEGTLPSHLNQWMIDNVLDFDYPRYKISQKHFWINPISKSKLGNDRLVPLFDRLFATPERLEIIQKKAVEHKDWKVWHEANPFKSKRDFARGLLERLVTNIRNEDLPDGQGFNYTDLKYRLSLVNEQLPLRPDQEAEEDLLRFIFDAGDYCANGVFHQLADLSNNLIMDQNELPRKILTHLEERRFQVGLAYFQMRDQKAQVLDGVNRLFGEKADVHRNDIQFRRDLAFFGLPERGMFEDKTAVDAALVTTFLSTMNNYVVMDTPGFYDSQAIIDWLDFQHRTFKGDMRVWLAHHPQILEAYNRRERKNLLLEDVEIDQHFINWTENIIRTRKDIELYLLEIGVFVPRL